LANRRVLIVDDSVMIRRALTEAISRERSLEFVGSAPNGRTALLKIPLLLPHVVVLDFDMTETSDREALRAIRQQYPALPVVVLTTPDPDGAAATIEALTLGASDYVTRPDTQVPSEKALKVFGDEVASKVSVCSPPRAIPRPSWTTQRAAPTCDRPTVGVTENPGLAPAKNGAQSLARRADVVAIGVSTGGPAALMDLLTTFPADFPVPILIVQHMPPAFTKLLADRLSAKASIRVAEGRPSQPLLPGHAWIAPGDFHMAVERSGEVVRIVTNQQPPENSCRPAVDVLFRSVAQVFGQHALAVIMTGMGQDGLRGCADIQAAGGHVLVQDEASSVVWGMPGFVARAGIAEGILPLDRLGAEIIARVSRHRPAPAAVNGKERR
jgi:two-component system chemotaxis response regulator CheB